jgi:hypothetical protein
MRWTFRVILRPGRDDEVIGAVTGETETEGMSLMDDWIREHGRPDDQFVWTRDGPNDVGAGTYGEGTVREV